MSDFDPLTRTRVQFLAHATADDYADAVLDLNEALAADVLAGTDLPEGTALQAKLARKDTRLAFSAIARILSMVATTEERRENLVFLLAKAIDDSLNLGAFYMAGRPKDELPPPIIAEQIQAILRKKSSNAGKQSGEVRSALADDLWKNAFLSAAKSICNDTAITQSDLADRLLSEMPEGKWKPEKSTLVIQLGLWEKAGEFTRRKPRRKASHNRVTKVRLTR